jgi:hypothetical protein
VPRRVPIEPPPTDESGQHRPEVVVARVAAEAYARVEDMEIRMADLNSVLARLDAAVAASGDVRSAVEAEVRTAVEQEVAGHVEGRLAQLEANLGLSVAPVADLPEQA